MQEKMQRDDSDSLREQQLLMEHKRLEDGEDLPDSGELGRAAVTGGDFGPGEEGGSGGVGGRLMHDFAVEKIQSSPTPDRHAHLDEGALRTANVNNELNEQSVATTATSMATATGVKSAADRVKYTTVDGKTLDLDIKMEALSEELELAQLLNS